MVLCPGQADMVAYLGFATLSFLFVCFGSSKGGALIRYLCSGIVMSLFSLFEVTFELLSPLLLHLVYLSLRTRKKAFWNLCCYF